MRHVDVCVAWRSLHHANVRVGAGRPSYGQSCGLADTDLSDMIVVGRVGSAHAVRRMQSRIPRYPCVTPAKAMIVFDNPVTTRAMLS
jgi:hypothetical protein